MKRLGITWISMPGLKPKHGLRLWLSLLLHVFGPDLPLNDGSEVKF